MTSVSRRRAISAERQTIWDVLADFGAVASWAPRADHSCIMNGGADGTLGATRRVQIGRNALVERIVEFDPPDVLAYSVEGLPRRVRSMVNRWSLHTAPAGTEVELTSSVVVGGSPAGRAAEWALCRGMAKESDAMLAGLARRMEQQ